MNELNEYPKALYKCPGPVRYEGDTHDTITVASAEEEAAAVTDGGWHPSLPEARTAYAAAQAAEAEAKVKAAEAALAAEAEAKAAAEAEARAKAEADAAALTPAPAVEAAPEPVPEAAPVEAAAPGKRKG